MDPRYTYPSGPTQPAWRQTATYVRDPVTALERWSEQYGDLFSIQLVGFGKFVFAAAPQEIRQILTADPRHVLAGATNGQLEPIVGSRSVLTLDGEDHHRHRRMMLPPFHGERMATYAGLMRDVTRRTLATWPTGTPFALHPHMLRITLELILEAVFGIKDSTRLTTFGDLFSELIERWSSPLLPMLAFYGLDAIKVAPWLPVSRRKRALDRLLAGEIKRRRMQGAGASTDVFGLLLAARDDAGNPLTEEELRDELVTLMIAGHETSATTLAWVFERVLHHPEVLARVREELATITKDGELDVGALDRLVYLDAVVRETLRQRPIFAFIGRRAAVDFEIGGHLVPPGTFLCPAIHLAHRRPESYPDPDRFMPERFLGKKADPYRWLPFGGGGRRCLGMAFALFEIKAILATVLSSTELRLESRSPLARTLRGIAVAPVGGTRVIKS